MIPQTGMSDESQDDTSGEEQVQETKDGSSNAKFLATADPRDTTNVSPEIQKIFDESSVLYWKLAKKDSDELYYGQHKIWPTQFAIAETFIRTQGVTSLRAEPGFGKTLVGIAVSQLVDVCAIFVPTNLVGPWVSFFKSYGLLNAAKPLESDVLVYSTKIAASHRNYLEAATSAQLAERQTLIVISPQIHMSFIMKRVFSPEVVGDREFTVIVDEVHKPTRDKALGSVVQPLIGKLVTRELLMSGSELTDKIIKTEKLGAIDHDIHVYKTNETPEEHWTVKLMDSPSYKEGDDWIDEVEAIAQSSKKLVIACEHEAREMLIANDIFFNKEVMRNTGQINLKKKFDETRRVVLFVSKGQTTGLNVWADTMIVLNPGDYDTEGLVQLSKRIVRHDNPNKNLYFYMLCGIPKDYYRAYYAKAFSLDSWPFGRSAVADSSMVYKAIGAIRLCGHDHETIDRVDLCVFLADYAELQDNGKLDRPYEQVLEWWENHKLPTSVLTPEVIRNIIFL